MTPDALAQIARLLEQATAAEWCVKAYPNKPNRDALEIETVWTHGQLDGPAPVVGTGIGIGPHRETTWIRREDADLICALRNAAPALIAAQRTLHQIEAMRERIQYEFDQRQAYAVVRGGFNTRGGRLQTILRELLARLTPQGTPQDQESK